MPIFAFVVLFALWSMYEIRKSNAAHQKRSDAFWAREREADNVRKKDISQLDYITIPLDALPFQEHTTDRIQSYQETIKDLVGKPILNLTGYSNTDLKLEYGAANLTALSDADANYTKLVSTLARLGQELYQQGNVTDAKTILKYGVSIGTDVSSNYTLLGQIYLAEDDTNAIYDLMDQASQCQTLMRDSILNQLRNLLKQD